MTYNSVDFGEKILPVHRLKLRWLNHRHLLLPTPHKFWVQKLWLNWQEWEPQREVPEVLKKLDHVYKIARKQQKEFGV